MAVSLIRTNLTAPKTRYRDSNIGFYGDVLVEGSAYLNDVEHMGAIKTQKIYRISDCIDTIIASAGGVGWTEETSGQCDMAITAEGPTTQDSSMTLTTTATTSAAQVYIDYSTAVDWSEYDYIGMWYKAGNDDTIMAQDYKFGFFQESKTTWANVSESHDVMSTGLEPEDAAGIWRYSEVTLDTDRAKRSAVTRFAIYENCPLAATVLFAANIELFKYGTSNGPVRGQIRSYPTIRRTGIAKGDIVALGSDGCVLEAVDNGYNVLGVCVTAANSSGESGTLTYADVVVDGVVNLYASEILTAGDGVCVDSDTGPSVDDGGAADSDVRLQFGVALVTCIAKDVVPVLIGSRGFVGAIGT